MATSSAMMPTRTPAAATVGTMPSGITDDILGGTLDSPAMAKKVRSAGRTRRRPGERPASERSASARRPAGIASTSQLEAAEAAAEDVVEERPAAAAAILESSARSHPRARVKPGSLLAAKAATEYVYVAKDMRRILVVAALLGGVMLLLWVLLVVMRVVPLPFY
jgi:hypothetical protein